MLEMNYDRLLDRLIDLKALAVLPEQEERTLEISSYDRRSAYDENEDRYIAWGANFDGKGHVCIQEDGGVVLADIQGNGCIDRIWSGGDEGQIAFFLDGGEPYVLPFRELFNGTRPAYRYEQLAYGVNWGYDFYIPISFRNSCRVVAYGRWQNFYQIQYTLFPEGSVTETFSEELCLRHAEKLMEINRKMSGEAPKSAVREEGEKIKSRRAVKPGEATCLFAREEAGMLTELSLRITPALSWTEMKKLTIKMFWDDAVEPAVWSPLNSFFGTHCGEEAYRTLALSRLEDGTFTCRFPMPFAQSARIELINGGKIEVEAEVCIQIEPLPLPMDRLAYFHAKWNTNAFQPDRADRWPDYTVLKAQGRGRLAGISLHVYKRYDNLDPESYPGEYWWGEGDEKFFVDGEKFPSWFGTGEEDYFGFSWAIPDPFFRPYHAQIHNEGGIHFRGNRSLLRLHITDNVPFQTGLEACLEKYYSDTFVRFAAVSYWYQDTPTDEYTAFADDVVEAVHLPAPLPAPQPSRLSAEQFPAGSLIGVQIVDGGWECASTQWGCRLTAESSPFIVAAPEISFDLAGTPCRDPDQLYVELVTEDGRRIGAVPCDGANRTCRFYCGAFVGEKAVFRVVDAGVKEGLFLRISQLQIP